MWLIGRLTPDFKTIADFRRDNGAAIRAACARLLVLCRQFNLFTRAVVAIDGSKFKAVNNRDKNFTVAKVAKRIEQVEAAPDKQVSLTDPDARSMATSGKGTGIVGYNVQIAVDVEHHLIVAHEVTNIGTDRAQLASMGGKARDAIGCEEVALLADRGYYSADEVLVLRLSRRIDGPTFLTMYRYARHWGRGVVHLRGGPELWGRFLS
jgi:hypothetical protein